MTPKRRPSLRLVTAKEFSDCIRDALSKLPADERLIVNRYVNEVTAKFRKGMGLVSLMRLFIRFDPEMAARFDALDEEVVDHALQEVSRD